MRYLHIGNGITIKKSGIIGIFDLDSSTVSGITRKYISENERKGRILYGDSDLPRAFILYDGDGEGDHRIRLSRISSGGLKQRAENDYNEYNDYKDDGRI